MSSLGTSSLFSGFTICCLTRDFVRSSRIWKWTVLSTTAEYRPTGTEVEPIFSLPFQIARAVMLRLILFRTLAGHANATYGNRFLYTDRTEFAVTHFAVIARFVNIRMTTCRTVLVSRFQPPNLVPPRLCHKENSVRSFNSTFKSASPVHGLTEFWKALALSVFKTSRCRTPARRAM